MRASMRVIALVVALLMPAGVFAVIVRSGFYFVADAFWPIAHIRLALSNVRFRG
jgi:hypothetical protein